MKIYKISQKHEDEGMDFEEKVEDRDRFEDKVESEEFLLGKRGNAHTAKILSEITPIVGERLQSSYIANGSVGWYKYSDGIIYEIIVSPAAYGKYFDYYQELLKR